MIWNSTFALPGLERYSKCKVCGGEYVKRRMGHKVCGQQCAVKLIEQDKEKQARKAAKAERRRDKQRLEALQPLEYHLKKTERACNAYIRYRDRHDPCISCGRTDATVWNAGHYISVGANRTLRFNEDNIHKQCARPCNKDQGGNHLKYRQRLLKKIGVERVEWLEGWHEPVKMTREKAEEIAKYYRDKLKELKKANECGSLE